MTAEKKLLEKADEEGRDLRCQLAKRNEQVRQLQSALNAWKEAPLSDGDKDRCVELAKIFDKSWTTLQSYEWKIGITLWSTIVIITVAFVGGVSEGLGFKFNTTTFSESVDTTFLTYLGRWYWGIGIAQFVGVLLTQTAYAYVGKNREYYIAHSIDSVNDNISDNPRRPETMFYPQRIRKMNLDFYRSSVFMLLASPLFTGMLLVASYYMIDNAMRQRAVAHKESQKATARQYND